MSFADIRTSSSSSSGTINRASIIEEQHSITHLAQLLTSARSTLTQCRKSISDINQPEYVTVISRAEGDVKALENMELRIKRELEYQLKQLVPAQRANAAPKRVALQKLEKEFESFRTEFQICRSSLGSKKSFAAVTSKLSSSDHISDESLTKSTDAPSLILEETEHEDIYEKERLNDVRRINQDLRLVNEMFKDVAEIIRTQDASIQKIEDTTELSHDRVEEGLRQIEIAAKEQPNSCSLS